MEREHFNRDATTKSVVEALRRGVADSYPDHKRKGAAS